MHWDTGIWGMGYTDFFFALFWSVWKFLMKFWSSTHFSREFHNSQGKCILEHQIIPKFYFRQGYCHSHKYYTLKQRYLKMPSGFCSWKNKMFSWNVFVLWRGRGERVSACPLWPELFNNCPGQAGLESEPCIPPTSLQSKLTKPIYYSIGNINVVR